MINRILNIGDEIYKIKKCSKYFHYYKIKIYSQYLTRSRRQNGNRSIQYTYRVKGSSKLKNKILNNILTNSEDYFTDKIDMFKMYDNEKVSKQLRVEIEKSKIINAEYWV